MGYPYFWKYPYIYIHTLLSIVEDVAIMLLFFFSLPSLLCFSQVESWFLILRITTITTLITKKSFFIQPSQEILDYSLENLTHQPQKMMVRTEDDPASFCKKETSTSGVPTRWFNCWGVQELRLRHDVSPDATFSNRWKETSHSATFFFFFFQRFFLLVRCKHLVCCFFNAGNVKLVFLIYTFVYEYIYIYVCGVILAHPYNY